MKKNYSTRTGLFGIFLGLILCCQSSVFAQVSLTATGGTPTGSFTTLSDAFAAINAGTHTGSIAISIDGNTTEPAAPAALSASGQGATLFTDILIKPSVVATISGATNTAFGVITLDGSDNVTIDGSIAVGGTTRDLTIQNTAAINVSATAAIRLIGRTTLGLGVDACTIKNCNVIGNTPGNSGFSGSTVSSSIGIYAGGTTISTTGTGSNYDNLTIENNLVKSCYNGIHVMGGSTAQCDNLIIRDNIVGSALPAEQVSYRGIIAQHIVNGIIERNTVFGLIVNTSVTVSGIDLYGSGTTGTVIRRNTVSDVKSYSTNGYGAYGINISSGTGTIISNNVIHGVETTNYSATSNLFNAFGIRLAGGTGHKVFYNSVNMYGNYTTGSITLAASAAFAVTSTTVIGIEIRNNVFANKMTATSATPYFFALWFPSAYNFLNATIDNNAYLVSSTSTTHFVGKVGTTATTGNYLTLNDWRTISQVNNATNDVNSVPGTGNINAPFTADNNLVIPAATITVLESTGIAIASLGLPNIDITGVNRPAGTGSAPDMGAYEFEGTQPSDLTAPVVSAVSATPGASCTIVSHVVSATVVEDQAMGTVTLSYAYAGVAQTPIAMTLASGTMLNGTWTATIPAAAGPNVSVTYSVQASDLATNTSASVSGSAYADEYLSVTASADQTINTNVGTSVFAASNDGAFNRLLISEIIQYKGGTGDGVYPAYIPITDNDFVEIVNYNTAPVDASGYTLTLYGGINGTYTIPGGSVIPSGATLVLAFSGTTVDPTNLYFGMGFGTTSSGIACGFVLKDANGEIADAVATNSYTFAAATGVTAAKWSGNIGSNSGLAGSRRTGATDTNTAADWTGSAAANLTNIGVYNTEITIVPLTAVITWTNNFNATSSTSNPLPVAGFATPGTYTFTATYNDGTCTVTDDVVITVITPTVPVADFSATPLVGTAPLNVSFTDLSANFPDSWAWTVSPMTGVTFVSATTAASQNPVIQFANAGLYTITLVASNVAGSDDEVKLQYIDVDFCASGATSTADTDIGNVTFGSLNNGNALPTLSNPAAVGTYSDFTALPVQNFGVGQTYPISVTQYSGGTSFYAAHANVFIDYNNDGFLDPATELVFSGSPASAAAPTASGTVTIPLTAFQGNVLMRVVLTEGGSASSPPCGTFSWGETEDYIINIQCSSVAPTAGTDEFCASGTSTLTATGNSVQWYADANTATVLSTGGTYTTPTITTTTSYFATTTDVGCIESERVEFVVTVNQNTASSETVTECVDYMWAVDGMTYAATGMYTATIPNAAGCDSVITLDLTISGATTGTDVVSECGTYDWIDGMTYTSSNNTATFMLQTAAGCDSLVTLNLTILNATSSTQVVASCTDYVWAVDGMTYNTTGMYTATIPNAAGCDSVITLDFTMNVATSSTENVASCGDYLWSANGMTYSTPGTYTALLPNAAGCDSMATLILTIATVSDLGVTFVSVDATLVADLAPAVGISYAWLDCDNGFSAVLNASAPSFTPAVDGNYAVQITENGCVDTSACFLVDNVGLDFNKLASVSIVPNPTNDMVTLTFEGSDARLTILDLNGKMIKEMTVTSGSKVDLSAYENGVYLFTLYSDSFKTVERVVKQ